MNSNKLKGARVAKGLTQQQMSNKLGMTIKTYNRKELGLVEFNRKEVLDISSVLELSLQEVNEIFFGNQLTERLKCQSA